MALLVRLPCIPLTAAALVVAGCVAGPIQAPAPDEAALPPSATLVSIRPLAAAAGGARLREFVVRDDTGRALSIVQDDALGLREGETVRVRPGPRAQLTRLAP